VAIANRALIAPRAITTSLQPRRVQLVRNPRGFLAGSGSGGASLAAWVVLRGRLSPVITTRSATNRKPDPDQRLVAGLIANLKVPLRAADEILDELEIIPDTARSHALGAVVRRMNGDHHERLRVRPNVLVDDRPGAAAVRDRGITGTMLEPGPEGQPATFRHRIRARRPRDSKLRP